MKHKFYFSIDILLKNSNIIYNNNNNNTKTCTFCNFAVYLEDC